MMNVPKNGFQLNSSMNNSASHSRRTSQKSVKSNYKQVVKAGTNVNIYSTQGATNELQRDHMMRDSLQSNSQNIHQSYHINPQTQNMNSNQLMQQHHQISQKQSQTVMHSTSKFQNNATNHSRLMSGKSDKQKTAVISSMQGYNTMGHQQQILLQQQRKVGQALNRGGLDRDSTQASAVNQYNVTTNTNNNLNRYTSNTDAYHNSNY